MQHISKFNILTINFFKKKNKNLFLSSRYCNPIRIRFVKESDTNITNEEINYIQNQINKLSDKKEINLLNIFYYLQ